MVKKVQPWIAVVLVTAVALVAAHAWEVSTVVERVENVVEKDESSVRPDSRMRLAIAGQGTGAVTQVVTKMRADAADTSLRGFLACWSGHILVSLVTLFWIVFSGYFLLRYIRRPLNEIRQGLAPAATPMRPITGVDCSMRDGLLLHGSAFLGSPEPVGLAKREIGLDVRVPPDIDVSDMNQQSIERIERIAEEMRESVSRVVGLQMDTASVETIVETVSQVAEQMHLLALNAMLEAVNGGEAEREFAAAAGRIAAETAASVRRMGITLGTVRDDEENKAN